MPTYDYMALDHSGKKKKGILEADSARGVRQLLRDKQWTPLSVQENSAKSQQTTFFPDRNSIKPIDLALFSRQLASLLQAGLNIELSLSAISQQSESPSLKRITLAIRSRLREGHSLASCLAQFPKAFPQLYCASVAAGEHSGHLNEVLEHLANYTEQQVEFRQKIQLALIYPLLLFGLSLLIVTGLMIYVVPDIVQVITDAGQQLPLLTQLLISSSDFLQSWGLLTALLLTIAVITAKWQLKKPKVALIFHRRLLKLPFIKRFSRGGNAARYISTLAILTNSGTPLVQAMTIASRVVSNKQFAAAVDEAGQEVREGISLNKALAKSRYIPPMMLHLIASGESSGDLPTMLQRASTSQQHELQRLVATLVALFEPIMLILMGGFVLIIVLAVMLPILNLNQLIS